MQEAGDAHGRSSNIATKMFHRFSTQSERKNQCRFLLPRPTLIQIVEV